MKVSELHLQEIKQFDWDEEKHAFEIDINDSNLFFDNFFDILKKEINNYKFPLIKGLNFWVNDKKQVFNFAYSGAKQYSLLDLEEFRKYEKDIKIGKCNVYNKETIIDFAKKLLKIIKILSLIRKKLPDVLGFDSWVQEIVGIIEDHEKELIKIFNVTKYMTLGVFFDGEITNNKISEKSLPFSITVEVDFSKLIENKVYIKPLDIVKISNKNISINNLDVLDNEIVESLENREFSEEKSLTINFLVLEKLIKEENLNQENIFTETELTDKNKWNTLINEIQILFNLEEEKIHIKNKILFFDPKEEIKSLYESYDLAIKTIFREDGLTEKQLSESLLQKLINKEIKYSQETLDKQIINVKDESIESLGLLKENIIESNDKFDYFTLNINQRIFSNKALNNFTNETTNLNSNVIALNGPPGTGKTTFNIWAIFCSKLKNPG